MVAALVLLGYVITLAPTVTLWDAGEFITAAKVLGIPHPPGTPLFVLLGHVWAGLLPVGGYAWRTNLMSACFSAAGAGCFFLVVDRLLRGEDAPLRLGAAAAAALISAFTFTVWQNSNETEVYTVATFSIAAIAWLAMRWRDLRGTAGASHHLLLIVYLGALSIGNHLLALLVGPAVSAFVFHALFTAPAADRAERRAEWGEWAVVSALWVLLVAVGLGSTPLLVLGGVLYAAALVACARGGTGSLAFGATAFAVGAVGVSTYAFLYIRSGLEPLLDEADPDSWRRLVDVIRRRQYTPRSPFDNPTFLPGLDNPGRTPRIVFQQLVNYAQYFDWQWARGLGAARVVFTALFAALGLAGAVDARRRDRSGYYLLGMLWLVTGLGLVAYMNFKPGFSLFWNEYRGADQHEVRERDYFFTVSFQTWGLFAGLGLAGVVRELHRRLGRAAYAAAALALLPFALNFTAASRRHGPDATLARDWAYDLLQSVEPYGVLFGFGDNDTFPVWYAQEVEGERQDVTLVNLSLANLDWYLRQLRDRPARPFDPARAPAVYAPLAPVHSQPPGPILSLSDAEIAALQPVRLEQGGVFRAADGRLELSVRAGQSFLVADQVVLLILAQQLGKRPVTFGTASGRGAGLGLGPYLVQQGLAFQVFPGRPDSVRGLVQGMSGAKFDAARTELLVERVFRYSRLFRADTLALEPAAEQIARSLSGPFVELANVYAQRGDQARTLDYLRRAYHLSPSAGLAAVIDRVAREGVQSLFRP